MSFPDILSLVPHSGSMALLDRVLSADEGSLCAQVTIRPQTLFCEGATVGVWVGLEYMAQAIAAHAGYLAGLRGDPVKVGFLLGARRYECSRASFALGSVLHIHVRCALQGENGLGAFECRIDEAGDVTGIALANATITVFQPENVDEFLQGLSK